MPKLDGRLELWRRSIYLFHRTVKRGWIGPFLAAGYQRYKIGPMLLDNDGRQLTPDIVTANSDYWAAIDLTLRPDSKESQLLSYRGVRTATLRNHELPSPPGGPVLAVARAAPVDDGSIPVLVLGRTFSVLKPEAIPDSRLQAALRNTVGADLARLPEIPITIVPEIRNRAELRRGISPILMLLFSPSRPTFSAAEIVDLGLERLSDRVSITDKLSLIDKVKQELQGIARVPDGELSSDIEVVDGAYRARNAPPHHQKTLERIGRVLTKWGGEATSLADFGLEP